MLPKKLLISIPISTRTIRKLCADSLNEEITFSQFRILSLTHEKMGQTQMAHALQISVAAVSKVVEVLERKKLLKKDFAKDRRFHDLTLTPEGNRLRNSVRLKIEKILQNNVKKLSKTEQSDLEKGLEILNKLMGFVNEN